MLHLGGKIVIVADVFEQNLPVGEYGYLIAYDRNPDNAFDYIVRIPQANRNFFVTEKDIELEEKVVQFEVEQVERAALIDYALATHNEKLFHQVMNGEEDAQQTEAEPAGEPMSQAEFIKKINLRAWI
ncbi:ATPase [Saccharibacillus sp. CPCC 101409]|uniref:ATPase n=1 Tax=Saccharibacillus sp. CPCC 101409 TaxID=3058041 RepID=UPI002672CE31|nr:ATPase [Saccharibacillus sp. CPCC 101409]MDO3412802.1 ATPase [Saccharibacillus sp. CPCC 101409]